MHNGYEHIYIKGRSAVTKRGRCVCTSNGALTERLFLARVRVVVLVVIAVEVLELCMQLVHFLVQVGVALGMLVMMHGLNILWLQRLVRFAVVLCVGRIHKVRMMGVCLFRLVAMPRAVPVLSAVVRNLMLIRSM